MICYSYVMGVSDEIKKLEQYGFKIQNKGNNYMISFPQDKSIIWEEYISYEIKPGFWNEYIGKDIVFIFKFKDGNVKKYILDDSNKDKILKLCCTFANFEFESIEKMLKDNDFYNEHYFSNKD